MRGASELCRLEERRAKREHERLLQLRSCLHLCTSTWSVFSVFDARSSTRTSLRSAAPFLASRLHTRAESIQPHAHRVAAPIPSLPLLMSRSSASPVWVTPGQVVGTTSEFVVGAGVLVRPGSTDIAAAVVGVKQIRNNKEGKVGKREQPARTRTPILRLSVLCTPLTSPLSALWLPHCTACAERGECEAGLSSAGGRRRRDVSRDEDQCSSRECRHSGAASDCVDHS